MALFAFLRCTCSLESLLAGFSFLRSFQGRHFYFLNPSSVISRRNLEPTTFVIPFPGPNFSSKAIKPSSNADLIHVIDAKIKCAEECDDHDQVEEIPEGFPFEIQNENGRSTITLKRSYLGENVEVLVFMPSLVTGEDPEHDRRDNLGGDEGESEKPSQSSIPLTINFTKKDGHGLQFCCTAYPDELVIDSMSFKENRNSDEDMLTYQGPDFSDLDENLQKSFYKYLELRGISAMTTNFLHEYMINKDSREYLLWLRNLKKLFEK